MAFDAKAATPDTTIPSGAFLLGADSQSAGSPSVYAIDTTIMNYIRGLAQTWSVNGALSAPAASWTGTWITGGSATTTKPQVLLEPTGTTSTGWSTAGTGLGINAPSGFAGNLFDFQVNGATKGYIDATGAIIAAGNIKTNGSLWAGTNTGSILLGSSSDIAIYRDAAGVLAQRNGTNAQTFRVYNNYTDSSNYEALNLTWSGNTAFIRPIAAGTGTVRDLVLGTGTQSRLLIKDSTGSIHFNTNFIAETDNTYDIGAAGANRPRNIYAGTSLRGPETITGALKDTSGTGVMSLSGSVATFAYGVATPAGGSTSARVTFGTTAGFGVYYGSGAPTVSAAKGSLYIRSDGSGTSDRMYVNTDGATTWTAVTTAA